MRVLLVDDTRANQVLIGKYLRDLGHQVILASDGVEALEVYQQSAPDLVLLDVMMPKMDGYQVTVRIRELEGETAWTPIIFLSAKITDADIAAGIDAGGDDYLSKPVSKVVLAAKMGAMSRIAQMRSTIQEYAQTQALINQRDAEERDLARHVFDRMTRLQNLDHDWIEYVSRPSSHFSGDIIAAETTPAGDLHLILGDATGHGLAAGLTVMPLADLFHALTARGEGLVTIARNLNERLHDLLPTGRFVAAIMVAVKPATRTIEVWNGGCPPVYWINAVGGVKTTFDSHHLPLGVLREITDNRSTSMTYDPENPGKLYLFTDGVPDAENRTSGKQFTLGRVGELLAASTDHRLDRLMETLEKHIGETTAQDDISIVEISPPQREMVGDQQLLIA
ncbi:MAG: SpoIIE family protein phosphatase [Gammaproteobacteria bacterium]